MFDTRIKRATSLTVRKSVVKLFWVICSPLAWKYTYGLKLTPKSPEAKDIDIQLTEERLEHA